MLILESSECLKTLVDLVGKLLFKIMEKKAGPAFLDTEKQTKYLEKFSKPKNDIERSYYQYRCQMKQISHFKVLLLNVLSFPIFIIWLLRFNHKEIEIEKTCEENIAVFYDRGNKDSLPVCLKEKFSDFILLDKTEYICKKEDGAFFRKKVWKKHPFSFYFLLKNLVKMTKYRDIIYKVNPSAIIVCNEYSFTSSFLTLFCNLNKIKHIDVIHGEKLFNIRDAFFRYDECYVWDKYYIELFRRLKAESNQFVVVDCPICDEIKQMEKVYDYTYYLQSESKEMLEVIFNALYKLKKNGARVAYRPHPVYESEYVAKTLKDFDREDTSKIPIKQSILQTNNVISRYSTVLYQAYCLGAKITIDDITNRQEYLNLKNLGYIMMNKPHGLLSDFLKDSDKKI